LHNLRHRHRDIGLPYPSEFMTAEVLARHLSVETETVDRWTALGILPQPIKPKGVRLWRWSKVVAALDPDEESVPQSATFDPGVEAARVAAERRRNGRAA
jgi:hypothetical protein